MKALFTTLQWLPQPPVDFNQQLKSAAAQESFDALGLQFLAQHALDINQLTRLARLKARLAARTASLQPLVPFKLAILSNSTIDLLVPALVATALRHGIDLTVIQPPYDQIAQQALTPDSMVNASRPDA